VGVAGFAGTNHQQHDFGGSATLQASHPTSV
jgi:hypothetical protein